MVWPLAPTSATARVPEVSTLALAHSFAATHPTNDLVEKGKKTLWDYLSTSKPLFRCTLRFSDGRSRGSFWHKICMFLENKEAASVLSSELFELARKTVNPLANTAFDRDSPSEGESEKGRQTGKEIEQATRSRFHLKAATFVLEAPKQEISLSGLKRSFWKSLGSSSSSLDATPLVPVPPFTGGLISLLGFILILGVILDRWIGRASRGVQLSNASDARVKMTGQPMAPTGISVFLERDLKKKESVEWVNMVLGKLWKVYRLGLESWLVGLLQPLIDNLQKPGYVERVQIKQFFLGDEPISVRSVERRASRRANDLQYHIGLRYTGGARMLLLLKLKAGFIPITIPVGVRGLDVDGELWVKLRLVPSEPWVGTATWAFVSLPRIKLDLSPFRLFNLMAIPFLSVFLTKLFTQDLPRLFVRPNKILIDFLKGRAVGPVSKDFKGDTLEGNKDFSGELSVTLVDARKLNYVPYGKTDPYVVLILGDQVIRSKKNSQTSVFGPPGSPIWNQDFQLLVVDSKAQRLAVHVRDYFGLTTLTLGVGEVDLSALQDTVPADRVVRLMGGWGPFRKRFVGEILLRLTYTVYVEDEDEESKEETPFHPRGYLSETDENPDAVSLLNEVVNKAMESVEGGSSITDMFKAIIAEVNSEALEGTLLSEGGKNRVAAVDGRSLGNENRSDGQDRKPLAVQADEAERADGRTVLIWLGLVTGLAVLVDISLNFSNLLNP